MENPSLRARIMLYIKEKYPRLVHGGELERLGMDLGYKASNAGRRCRELEEEGKIMAIYNGRREVMYQWIAPKTRVELPPARMPEVNNQSKLFSA